MRRHPLAIWLGENAITRTEFAKSVGISPSHLTLVCKRERGVSIAVAVAIEKETKGKVKVADLTDKPNRKSKVCEAAE